MGAVLDLWWVPNKCCGGIEDAVNKNRRMNVEAARRSIFNEPLFCYLCTGYDFKGRRWELNKYHLKIVMIILYLLFFIEL